MGWIARKLKTQLSVFNSEFIRKVDEWIWFRKNAAHLKREAVNCKTPRDFFGALKRSPFVTLQKEAEIVGLLELIAELRPERVAEIGPYDGGTLFLFSRFASPSAHLFSLDMDLGFRRWSFASLIRPGQRLTCLVGDSHAESMRDRLVKATGGKPLDFLFIDGDHAFKGVKSDFQLYSELVRPGGLIAFHDIIPGAPARAGNDSANPGGDVWKYWKQLRDSFHDHRELLYEGPDQEGYGIGIIRWPGVSI